MSKGGVGAIAGKSKSGPRGPQHVGELVSELLARRGVGRRLATADRLAAWSEAVGAEFAEMTRPGAVRRGVLEVTVAHSALVQELTFQKRELLQRIQKCWGEIRDLRFRVGSIES